MTATERELSKKLLHAQDRILIQQTQIIRLEQRLEKVEAVVAALCIGKTRIGGSIL